MEWIKKDKIIERAKLMDQFMAHQKNEFDQSNICFTIFLNNICLLLLIYYL